MIGKIFLSECAVVQNFKRRVITSLHSHGKDIPLRIIQLPSQLFESISKRALCNFGGSDSIWLNNFQTVWSGQVPGPHFYPPVASSPSLAFVKLRRHFGAKRLARADQRKRFWRRGVSFLPGYYDPKLSVLVRCCASTRRIPLESLPLWKLSQVPTCDLAPSPFHSFFPKTILCDFPVLCRFYHPMALLLSSCLRPDPTHLPLVILRAVL